MIGDERLKGRTALAFSRPQLVLIALALMGGALLRLIDNDQPFPSNDHAELAALVSFFYPRDIRSLGFSGTSTWNLLTSGHGMLPPLIGLISSTLIGLAGVRLNEFWWNLPFVVLHLSSILLAAVLTKRLAGRSAGVVAAILVALLPIHAALSRASGLSHIPLMFTCQLISVLCFVRYFEQPSQRHARWASIALAANLLVELFFPLLFVLLLGVGVLTVATPRPGLGLRFQRARELLFSPRVMLLPIAVVCFNFALLILYSAGLTTYGGLAARLMEGSDRKGGLYLEAFWTNASFVAGPIALAVLLALGLLGLPALRRLEARAVPLLWSLIYLAPFIAFTRPNVYGYYLLGVAPLALNAAVVLHQWWHGRLIRRALAGLAVALLIGLFALRAVSMIFGRDILAFAGTGRAQGAVAEDQGLKAAAWWIRTHTTPDTLIFADAAYEPYQLAYYLHRPFLGVSDAEQPEDAYRLLDGAPRQPAFYLVAPGNEHLLQAHVRETPRPVLTVTVDRRPALVIYGYAADAPQTIDADSTNQQFDAQLGSWRIVFAIGTRQ